PSRSQIKVGAIISCLSTRTQHGGTRRSATWWEPMALKHTAMRHLGQMANACGLTTLATRNYGGAGAILMLHSVIGDDDRLPMENVHTSARFLEQMIRYYLAQRIPVLSLADALARL